MSRKKNKSTLNTNKIDNNNLNNVHKNFAVNGIAYKRTLICVKCMAMIGQVSYESRHTTIEL